ncbi:hypothetical protein SLEP1_g27203 [Rubroshorea leprosula]|uniref:BURP domain-containing protein n=1 Tax=Rubroshorea leprosula TaxID=152421 RepID=A0AAV5JV57_9ROSI|nr:hypothetical protein SLEP1_g27203 [Rubroshorea leprosula]
MGFHFEFIVALFCLGVVGSCHASMPAELYWKSVLPNTPMPKSLQDLLRPVNKNDFVKLKDDMVLGGAACTIQSNPSAEFKSADLEDFNGNHGLKSGSLLNSSANIFFFESDLHAGRLMKLLEEVTMLKSKATFLPRAVTDSMPFSSAKFFDILKLFSMDPKSARAKVMKQSIENCERESTEGEDKYCATSLESLIDNSVSRLGKNIQVLSTEVEKETKTGEFTIGTGVKNMGEKEIVCHTLKYPYAVFLCHSIDKTDVYKVPLIGSDGTKVKAIALCHKDTSTWNPRHFAFQFLKVKPGSVPICHFLAKESIAWVPN